MWSWLPEFAFEYCIAAGIIFGLYCLIRTRTHSASDALRILFGIGNPMSDDDPPLKPRGRDDAPR